VRALVNLVAGLVFVVGFPAVLFVDSALRYARDGEAWVGSARAAGLREALVDANAALVVGEVGRDPGLAALDRVFVRAGIDHVLSREWFDGTVRSVHAAAVTGARGASRTAAVDLGEFKRALGVRLGLVGERASDTCRDLFGAEQCADQGRAQQLIATYRQRAGRAIARVPDRLMLWPDAGGGENLDRLASLRVLSLVLVLASVIALAIVNWRRPRVLGSILACGAAGFLVLGLVLRFGASGPIGRFLLHRAGIDEGGDQPVAIAARGLHRLAGQIVADATRGGMIFAAMLAAAGLALIAIARARERRSR